MTTPPILPIQPEKPPVDLSLPKVRHAMILFPLAGSPNTRIEVIEAADNVVIEFELAIITVKRISLTLPEARALSGFLNLIAGKVSHRPAYRP